MAFAPIFAGNVVLAAILHAKSPVLALAAIATFALSMHLWAGRLTARIADARAGLPLERLRQHVTRWRGHSPPHHPIADIDPPAWVAVPAAAQARPPGSTAPPVTAWGREAPTSLDYRLCIARHHLRGEPVTLGFSDGTSQTWQPATRVATRHHINNERTAATAPTHLRGATTGNPTRPPEATAGNPARQRETAATLEALVRDISRNGSTPLESVIKNHSEEHPGWAVQHAVQAAVLWGLIATADGRDAQRLYALLGEPDPAEAAGIALTITHAGRVWLDCDPHRSAGPARRARRAPIRTEGPQNEPARTADPRDEPAPTSGAPEEAPPVGGVRNGPAEDEVLTALAEVLDIPEVWERPGLRHARDTLTVAVAGGHPDTPAVRSAVGQVLTLAGGLVLGVAGTGAYAVLRGLTP